MLAGSSTLNRLKLSIPEQTTGHRYKKIVGDESAMDRLLVEMFVQSYAESSDEIWLDLDATDDPAHGSQEGIFITATMTGIVTCPCMCSATDTCRVRGCGPRRSMPVPAPIWDFAAST